MHIQKQGETTIKATSVWKGTFLLKKKLVRAILVTFLDKGLLNTLATWGQAWNVSKSASFGSVEGDLKQKVIKIKSHVYNECHLSTAFVNTMLQYEAQWLLKLNQE